MEITNIFVKSFLQINNYPVVEINEKKEWGGYYILKADEKSDYKILWLKPKHLYALRFHGSLSNPSYKENWKALTKVRVVLGNNDLVLNNEKLSSDLENLRIVDVEPNETIEIPSGFLHALVNPFETDIYLFESRVSEGVESSVERELNTRFIYDQYSEFNAPKWPSSLLKKVLVKSV